MEQQQKIIVICGPTGIGKTSTAIRLAQEFFGEIVSADSMQVYREMDIGTAKPTAEEQQQVAHHLIDVVSPDEPFDAAIFSQMADTAIKDLTERNLLPFVVGGTGLYIKALVHGLSRARPADETVLNRLKEEADRLGSNVLHQRLAECDPQAAERIHPNDAFRIVRALEIFQSTGQPITRYHEDHQFADRKYHALKICLSSNREILYERIDRRVDIMLQEGLLEEVKELLGKGYHADLKSMQSLGYRHMTEFLAGETTWEEAVRTMKRDTRRYAKRQLTWFKADPETRWFEKDQTPKIERAIQHFLS